MGLFGGQKKDSYLGVDIGAGGVKVVELNSKKGRPTVLTYGYSTRNLGEIITSPFDDVKGTGMILKKICEQAGVKSNRVMAALPMSSVFTAIISIPRLKTEKEMKPLIDTQVAKLTPLPLSDMITYSTFIDPVKKDKEKKDQKKDRKKEYVRVLVTGAAKSLVQKYIEIFKVAKLKLEALDTEAFALIRSLIGNDKSSIMILDIGSLRTNITVVEKGVPFLTRSINVGGYAVTKHFMEKSSLSETEAEQMKKDLSKMVTFAETTVGGMPKILETAMQPILNEILYSFQLYEKMELTEANKVEKVILTGGSSHLPYLPEYFSEKLNLNVYRGDPWARVAIPHDLRPVLDDIGPKMSVAIGLAMREIE